MQVCVRAFDGKYDGPVPTVDARRYQHTSPKAPATASQWTIGLFPWLWLMFLILQIEVRLVTGWYMNLCECIGDKLPCHWLGLGMRCGAVWRGHRESHCPLSLLRPSSLSGRYRSPPNEFELLYRHEREIARRTIKPSLRARSSDTAAGLQCRHFNASSLVW